MVYSSSSVNDQDRSVARFLLREPLFSDNPGSCTFKLLTGKSTNVADEFPSSFLYEIKYNTIVRYRVYGAPDKTSPLIVLGANVFHAFFCNLCLHFISVHNYCIIIYL